MRCLFVLLVLLLQGCFFFFVAPTGDHGNVCVSRGIKAGQEIKNVESGQPFRVIRTYGTSNRCKDARFPILADGEYLYR